MRNAYRSHPSAWPVLFALAAALASAGCLPDKSETLGDAIPAAKATDGFESSSPGLSWYNPFATTSTNPNPWGITTADKHGGANGKASPTGMPNSSASGFLLYSCTATDQKATAVKVWYRVSSEANFDFFDVYVAPSTVSDFRATAYQKLHVSGDSGWQSLVVSGLSGTLQTFAFCYVKDYTGSSGLDRAFIDDVSFY
jgi:hypothetical protein